MNDMRLSGVKIVCASISNGAFGAVSGVTDFVYRGRDALFYLRVGRRPVHDIFFPFFHFEKDRSQISQSVPVGFVDRTSSDR